MSEELSLFIGDSAEKPQASKPLAEQLRPSSWDFFEGLDALDPALMQQLRSGRGVPPSLILWGTPGCGKTTLARLIGSSYHAHFVQFSAVLGGVKDVRQIIALAKKTKELTILFVDEIHRFNRSQQDAFLPHVEDGTIVLIGATTENPSFYLTAPLLSRTRVLQLKPLSEPSLNRILKSAADKLAIKLEEGAEKLLSRFAGGDGRRVINILESFVASRESEFEGNVSEQQVKEFLESGGSQLYDRAGDQHYNTVSAFIKSLRGSDADAALFWGFWMLQNGDDPRFLLRRMMIFASEDIGNADPRALQLAVAASEAFERLGLPEGRIPLAQCITYLATAPKSNSSYKAMLAVEDEVRSQKAVEVPRHLCNAPTKLMKELGYSDGYRYPHDLAEGYVAGEHYLPKPLRGKSFYKPAERGYEKTIKERLKYWRALKGTGSE